MSEAAKHTLRTVVQTAVGLCVLLPTVIGDGDTADTLPWAAGAVAVAGGLARLMALPAVQSALPSWLRTAVPVNSDQALRQLPAPAAPAAESAPAFGFNSGASAGTGTDAGTDAGPSTGPGSGSGSGEEGSGA
ncbi:MULTISPECIES: hypothetical protein [unclassified Streptomyces]|uniref:hypothetical protein n=1 Tax=unclassified Streptomyces TaxID=2593676 RepID=UPI002E2AD5A3|nr:hypothetical protein [Streptomyces sp. NBC_00223]